MREISAKLITEKVKEACIAANCRLPDDVIESFKKGKEEEKTLLGRQIFDKMLDNAALAAKKRSSCLPGYRYGGDFCRDRPGLPHCGRRF